MADTQPPNIVEGATTGDVEDELPHAKASAEDRKAASAMASLDDDARRDDDSKQQVDHEAAS